jgi:hypothetical protein
MWWWQQLPVGAVHSSRNLPQAGLTKNIPNIIQRYMTGNSGSGLGATA